MGCVITTSPNKGFFTRYMTLEIIVCFANCGTAIGRHTTFHHAGLFIRFRGRSILGSHRPISIHVSTDLDTSPFTFTSITISRYTNICHAGLLRLGVQCIQSFIGAISINARMDFNNIFFTFEIFTNYLIRATLIRVF
uniref:Uncharacterized protein n=1 Tax=Zea mays TaxID=4577 RepID=C0HH35_MAIZE|nr:unknown [Zea mays]